MAVIAACSGGDPGSGSPGTGNGDVHFGDPNGTSSGQGGSSSSSSGGSTRDAAPPPPNDPPDLGTPVDNPTNAFSGDPTYTSNPPAFNANAQHSAPVTGKPCLSCHDGTTCTKFDFAGTVWKAPNKTQGAADVEVRIIDNDSIAHTVWSDQDGNFWHRATKDLPMPALSGVRTSSWHAIGTLNGTSCNTCHNEQTSTPGRLFVD